MIYYWKLLKFNNQQFQFGFFFLCERTFKMRFLKNKIRKSSQATERRQQQQQHISASPNIKFEEDNYSSLMSPQILIKTETNVKMEDNMNIKDEEPTIKTEVLLDNNLKLEDSQSSQSFYKTQVNECPLTESVQYLNKEKSPENTTITKNKNYIKNIDLNYIKAIINFVNSHIALPYLKASLQKENLKFTTFVNFMSQSKECALNGIQAFRAMILDNESADESLIACKKILKQLSEVFIKYFSVNWIMHSKINSKEAYLKYRFQMLRKIQNPERYFTQTRKKSE